MKLGSLFDGAGGFPFAAQICGIDPVWASEIEPFPVAVTTKRFPNMKHLGDVTKVNGAEIEPVDIITFGSPCQSVSVAGKREGAKHTGKGDDETTRSGLFYEAIRIIKEMRDATNGRYPRIAVLENVPGFFSSAKGEDWRLVLEAFCQVKDSNATVPRPPKGKWADAGEIVGDGYSVAWRVLDAQYLIPQRRRRIFAVADFGGERAGEILFKREGLRRNFAESRASWKGITKSLAFRTPAEERTVGAFMGGQGAKAGGIAYSEDLAPTLKSAPSGGNTVPDVVYCLQANGIDRADTAGCNGRGWCEDVSYTLNTIDRHAVCVFDARGNGDGSTVPTVTGDHENRVTDYTAVVLACNWDGRQTAPTLTARNAGGVTENAR